MITEEYEPLADVNEYPLHNRSDIYPEFRFACEDPELPRSERTLYDWRCPGCVAHAEASVAIQGDRTETWSPTPGHPVVKPVRMSWLVKRSRYWGVR